MVSATKISRIETAVRPASLRDVRDLARLYELGEDEQAVLLSLAQESRRRPWWQEYGLPESLPTYVGLEAAAARILEFESTVIPALLQTESYARAMTVGSVKDNPPDLVERVVAARLTRQALLSGAEEPLLEAIVDEAALHRRVGGTSVMRDQLDALVAAAKRPQVNLRIMPFEAGAHPGVSSAFTILRFQEAVNTVVYVEGLAGQSFFENPTTVQRYERVFSELREQALPPEDTVTWLKNTIDSYSPRSEQAP